METALAFATGVIAAVIVWSAATKTARKHPVTVGLTVDSLEYIPRRAHHDDAGTDLKSRDSGTIQPGQRRLVPTGVRLALPTGTVADIRPRSGLAHKHGITVLNSPGTIDPGYRGEIFANLYNAGAEPFTYKRGDRICQLLILPAHVPRFDLSDTMQDNTSRGTNGHGSTGKD